MSQNCGSGRAFSAPACAVLGTMLAGLASPSEAQVWTGQPLAYVSNDADNTISVIDTGSNVVVDTIDGLSGSLAVASDGKRLYVAGGGGISIVDPATHQIVSTLPDAAGPLAEAPDGRRLYAFTGSNLTVFRTRDNATVADVPMPPFDYNGDVIPAHFDSVVVTPDSKRVYVAQGPLQYAVPGNAVVISARADRVVKTIGLGLEPVGGFETPDRKAVYFANQGEPGGSPATCGSFGSSFVAIDTATSQASTTIQGLFGAIAMAPDGKHVYAVNVSPCTGPGSVTIIETASNSVVGPAIAVGNTPVGIAVTPDGAHIYVTNSGKPGHCSYGCCYDYETQGCRTTWPGSVSVIDTRTNSLVTTVAVGNNAGKIAMISPPQGTPFVSLAAKLDVYPQRRAFALFSDFAVSSTASNDIHVSVELVKLQVGPYITGIPAGSFERHSEGFYTYEGSRGDGIGLKVTVERTGTLRYALPAVVTGFDSPQIGNPVQVSMSVGDDVGSTAVAAHFHPGP